MAKFFISYRVFLLSKDNKGGVLVDIIVESVEVVINEKESLLVVTSEYDGVF